MIRHIDLKTGFLCNNDCIHCVVSDKKRKNLSFNKIKKVILKYISEFSVINLTLTGGEVTIRDDYIDILSYIKHLKEKGAIKYIDIQTNGRRFSDDTVLNATIEVVDFYLISLHSFVPSIHNKITRSLDSFSETVEGLRKLVNKIGPDSIAIQTVINKQNYKTLQKTYEFAFREFGITNFNITFPHPIGNAFSKDVTPTYYEIKNYVNDALRFCLDNGFKPFIEALPMCVFEEDLRSYVFEVINNIDIDVLGYAGDEDGYIDYGAVFEIGHDKYESCKNCKYNNACYGVWKEYKQLYPDIDMLPLMKSSKI
jgi:MoaA/NifB/PqqE/SkfB family radical SAM enzyme